MRYCPCTKEQVCKLLTNLCFQQGTKVTILRTLPDTPLRLFEDGSIAEVKTGKQVVAIPTFSEEDLIFFWEDEGVDLLSREAVAIVYDWVYGALGEFHRALLKAFSLAEEDDFERLCEAFPDVGMAFSLWRTKGDDWLYEERHGVPRE